MQRIRKPVRHTIAAFVMVGGFIGALSPSLFSGGTAAASGGAPIVVRGIYQAADYPGIAAGFDARIAAFNKAGGIEGRKIKSLGVVDDGGTESGDLPLVQASIDEDHVVALTPMITFGFDGAPISFANEHKTPYIGWGPFAAWCNDPWAFSIDGCITPAPGNTTVGLASALKNIVHKPPSQTTIAIASNEGTSSLADQLVVASDFEAAGYKVVYNEANVPAIPPTSYTPEVTALLAVHPDVIFLNVVFADTLGLGSALKAAGFTGLLYNPAGYAEGLLSTASVAASLAGQYVVNLFPSNEESTNPAIIQIHKDLKAIGKDQPITNGLAIGYWSADMFIAMLQNAKAKNQPLTGAGIEKAANQGFAYKPSTKGGNGPQTFPAAHLDGLLCDSVLQVKGTVYKVAKPYSCYKNVKYKGTLTNS